MTRLFQIHDFLFSSMNARILGSAGTLAVDNIKTKNKYSNKKYVFCTHLISRIKQEGVSG